MNRALFLLAIVISMSVCAGLVRADLPTGTYMFLEYENNLVDSAGGANFTAGGGNSFSSTTYKVLNYSRQYGSTNSDSRNSNALGTANFTIAFWFKLASTGVQHSFFSAATGCMNVGGIEIYSGSSGGILLADGAANPIAWYWAQDTNWHRVVITRTGTNHSLYFDGQYRNGTNTFNNNYNQVNFNLGRYSGCARGLNGYMDQFIISQSRVWTLAEVQADYNSGNGVDYLTAQVITLNLVNLVNGSAWPNTVTFTNVTGNLTFNYFNITSTGFCVSYTGNGTGTNCSTGSGASTFFNVTNTTMITSTASVTSATYGSVLTINATQRYTNATINTFNVTNVQLTNTTTSGSLTIPGNNGSNNLLVQVPGNYSQNITCVGSSVTTVYCTASGFYDNLFNISARNLSNSTISTFSVTANSSVGSASANSSANVAQLPLLQGRDWTFIIDAPGYAITNVTLPANASVNTYTFSLSPTNSLYISVYDASTLSLLNGVNVTVELQSDTEYLNQSGLTGQFLFQNLTAGNYTVTVSGTGYAHNHYFVTITNRTTQQLNTYLAATSSNVIFTNKDSVTGDPISNATFTVQSQVFGNWVTIGQTTTDAFGQAVFQLLPLENYQFIVSAPGYYTKTGIVNTVITSYVVLLNANNTQSFTSYANDFTYKLSPNTVSANSTTFSMTTSSPSGTLQWFAIVVNYNGTSSIQNVTGSPSGGTASITIDFTNITGGHTVSANYYAKSVNIDEVFVLSRSWYVYGGFATSNYTFVDFMEYYGSPSSPLDMTTRGILITLVAVGLAVGAGLFIGTGAAIMVAATVFLVAGIFGWLGIGVTVIVVGGLFGLLLLGGRA